VSGYPLRYHSLGRGDGRLRRSFRTGGRRAARRRHRRPRAPLVEDAEEPFFLWVHLYDPHGPTKRPDSARRRTDRRRALQLPAYWPEHDRAITSAAWLTRAYEARSASPTPQLDRLVAGLGDSPRHTVLTVLADHGENMDEHESIFDHGDDLYDASLRVPWVWRTGRPPGRAFPCQILDGRALSP